jgi:hypothetical protein
MAKDYSLNFNGDKYYLLYSAKNKEFGGYINEYFKNGETYNIWSEMIAVHHFPNAYSPVDRIKDFKDYLGSIHVPSSLTFDDKKNTAAIDFILIAEKNMPVVMEFNVFKYEKSKKCGSIAVQYAKRYSATTTLQIEQIKSDFEKNRMKLVKKVQKLNIPEVLDENIDKCISALDIKNETDNEIKREKEYIAEQTKVANEANAQNMSDNEQLNQINEQKEENKIVLNNEEEEEEEEEKEQEQEEKIYMRKINNKVKEKIFELKKMPTKYKDMINTNDKTCGRKKKEDLKERAHNKNSEDNMNNKIKTHFFLYLYEIINENVENEKYKVKKIPTKVISNLNVFENKELWNSKISNILKTYKISSKYSKYNEWENKNIVEKIEKSKKEIKVKKILNLEFKELFGIFRRKLNNNKDITKELLEKIKGLDLLNNNDIYCDFNNFIKEIEILESYEYIESLKNLCLDYENWFNNKVARILTKKNYDD